LLSKGIIKKEVCSKLNFENKFKTTKVKDYQGRKKCKTSNMLIISGSRGIPLKCSNAISGNHNDAYELVETVGNML